MGITFSRDGTRVFRTANPTDLHAYTLSTPWDIDTMAWSYTYDLVTGTGIPSYNFSEHSISFSPDGLELYLSVWARKNDETLNRIFKYTLTVPYEISSISGVTEEYAYQGITREMRAHCFSPDMERLYALHEVANGVYAVNELGTPLATDSEFWTGFRQQFEVVG